LLTESPASGSTFAGWSGGECSGTQSNCQVTLSAAENVTATFNTTPGPGPGPVPVPVPGPVPVPPGTGTGTGSVPTGHVLSVGQIKAALSKVIKPSGKAATTKAITKAGAFAFSFSAPGAGTLVIDWFATVHRKQVLVAAAHAVLRGTKKATVRVRLTSKGRKLFKAGKKVRLATKAAFTPTGGATIRSTGSTTLKG
jgi:hypothetical protein